MQRLALIVLIVAAGCDPLSPRTNVPKTRYYTLDPHIDVPSFPTTTLSVGVRPLDFARVYKEPMVYRESDHEVKLYTYDQWTELPRDAVTRAIRDALIKTHRFADVGDAIAVRAPDLTLTGELRAFEELRTGGDPRARVEVRLSLRRALPTDGNAALWSDIVSAEVPLPQDDRAGFADAMSQAVAQLVATVANSIAAVDVDSKQ